MTFRGIVKNGVIVLQSDAELPEGTSVRVTPSRGPSKKSGKAAKEKQLPGFGAWSHRKDIKDGASFARKLRKNLLRRGGRGA